MKLTLEALHRRWPQGNQHIPGLIEGIAASAAKVYPRYFTSISPIAEAHMWAQFSEECGQGLEMIESLNYTAARLREVFPSHFTPAMAARWAHNQKMIGEIAYGGRMGNHPPPSTDGYDFRGAGLSQVTGREGFAKLQAKLDQMQAGFNIVTDPGLIIDSDHTLECAVADYLICGCLTFAEKDDIVGETKALNGGLNGLAERRRQLTLWKKEFGIV